VGSEHSSISEPTTSSTSIAGARGSSASAGLPGLEGRRLLAQKHITFGSRSTCACPRAAAYQRSFAVVYFAASLTGWLPLPSELLRLLYLLCSHTFFHVVSNEFPRSAHLELQDVYLLSFPCSRALVPFSQPSVAGTRACRLRHQWRFGPGRSWVIYLVGPRPFAFASLFSETDPAASFILTRWSDVRNEPACSDRCFARWL
jgi:hypothetical protein